MPLISSPSEPSHPRRKPSRSAILKALAEGTAYARRQAARDLIGVPEAEAALIRQLEREEDPAVRRALLDTLTGFGGARVTATLIAMLRQDDAGRRNEAVTALQQLSQEVALHMADLLSDPDPDMRIMAVDVLRLLPHPEAPHWLHDLLLRETHVNVAGVAIDRLAEIGTPAHLPALEAARTRFAAEPYIGFAADLVIRRIRALDAEGPR
ncbi:HEAT repeat domain-containing protein [Pseudooceanicola sp. CBS1P-1]|uniref:HEAT repeat domain-containing protein n=1 Tax=Pseudooceanicola albus TaxID=2692189 RepID=A0A6L7G8G0_9RHOB|nr:MULTISPECIES: HEAT repeat domain-containing protein [Pseudooceanicola]MBT9382847.1 HEAT repeat domain-containing protein [Pseudooceanicola endophyticus]MXN20229.1 HEAT repeat domain-containing protein [Pseudooceanicola albus]